MTTTTEQTTKRTPITSRPVFTMTHDRIFLAGYRCGYRDAQLGIDYRSECCLHTRAYRAGYDDGYADGLETEYWVEEVTRELPR